MKPATLTELAAALNVFAPEYMEAIKNRDGWISKASTGAHPGKGFCLMEAGLWDKKAAILLAKVVKI